MLVPSPGVTSGWVSASGFSALATYTGCALCEGKDNLEPEAIAVDPIETIQLVLIPGISGEAALA